MLALKEPYILYMGTLKIFVLKIWKKNTKKQDEPKKNPICLFCQGKYYDHKKVVHKTVDRDKCEGSIP